MKILLVCVVGMSSGALITKIEQAAADKGTALSIGAHAISELKTQRPYGDIILLGPQVGYNRQRVQALYPNTPVLVMDPMDYGMQNGKAILQAALNTAGISISEK